LKETSYLTDTPIIAASGAIATTIGNYLLDQLGSSRTRRTTRRTGSSTHRGAAVCRRGDFLDWNCPKYITPRYTAAEVETAIAPLKQRIAELEARLKNEK
jgi:hypothetical protein